jgi:glutaconate CoA-transferase subunit B
MSVDLDIAAFLVRAAEIYDVDRTVFTGFHWPVLAGELASRLRAGQFMQYFEAGFSTSCAANVLPTSTTDHDAFDGTRSWIGTTADVLLAMAPRFDAVVLDAANVDVRGYVNSTAVGSLAGPQVRLPGGGGAADVAARARHLVLLHAGGDIHRIQRRVEHVTTAPGPHTVVDLITRWGVLRLGDDPRLVEVRDTRGTDEFLRWLGELSIRTDQATVRPSRDRAALEVATEVLVEAARRGYLAAAKAVATTSIGVVASLGVNP